MLNTKCYGVENFCDDDSNSYFETLPPAAAAEAGRRGMVVGAK